MMVTIGIIKRIVFIIMGCGLLIPLYLLTPREPLPLTVYPNKNITTTGYQSDSWHHHISLQQQFVTPDGTIRYLDLGNPQGKPILLLHGTPTSSWMYRKVISGLVAGGKHRVIAPDMLGYGNSNKPLGAELYTTLQQSDRIVSLMSHLGVDQRDQVIHDIAGTRTWQLLRDHPNKIKNLLILNTVGFDQGFNPPAMMKSRPRIGYYFTKLITIDIFSRLIMTQTIKGMLANPHTINTTIIDGYLYPTMRGQWRVYGYFLSNLTTVTQELKDNQSYLSQHPDLLPKTRIIRGDHDPILSTDQIAMFQQYRGSAIQDIIIITGGQHLLAEDYPDTIINTINQQYDNP